MHCYHFSHKFKSEHITVPHKWLGYLLTFNKLEFAWKLRLYQPFSGIKIHSFAWPPHSTADNYGVFYLFYYYAEWSNWCAHFIYRLFDSFYDVTSDCLCILYGYFLEKQCSKLLIRTNDVLTIWKWLLKNAWNVRD